MTRIQRLATDFALATFTIAVLAFWLGNIPDELASAAAKQADLEATERAAAQQARLKAALRDLCGENGHADQVDSFTYRCYTKRGHKATFTARVQL